MAYFVEYTIPASAEDEEYVIPVNEAESGYTIPLSETDAEIVETGELSARSEVFGATLEEAREAAEEIIGHSRATEALLYDDPTESTATGVGTLVARYEEGAGWRQP